MQIKVKKERFFCSYRIRRHEERIEKTSLKQTSGEQDCYQPVEKWLETTKKTIEDICDKTFEDIKSGTKAFNGMKDVISNDKT